MDTQTSRAPLQQTEYLYSSARIRSMENALVSRDRLERLPERSSGFEMLRAVSDCGFVPVKQADGTCDVEATLQNALADGYRTVAEMLPQADAVDFLRLPYDCHNAKAAIKAHFRGVPADSMLLPLGTVPAETVAALPISGAWDVLPYELGDAAREAFTAFETTRDPRQIDFILDRACYVAMKACATASGCEFAVTLVVTKIDLCNLLIAFRQLRSGTNREARRLFSQAFLPGGSVTFESLDACFDAGADARTRWRALVDLSPYASLLKGLGEQEETLSPAALEKRADDFYMETARRAKMVPFGAEVAIGYLTGLEYAVKNLRILAAGKDAKLPAEVLRERVRLSYV